MRIIGDIPHSTLKITVFKMNDKVSIKLEKHLTEIILKFRDGGEVMDLSTAQRYLTPSFLRDIEQDLEKINTRKSQRVAKLKSDNLQILPEIL